MLWMGLISLFVEENRENEGSNEPWVANQVNVGFWAVRGALTNTTVTSARLEKYFEKRHYACIHTRIQQTWDCFIFFREREKIYLI